MSFEIRKATKRKVLARVALIGPSGSGKTYSSLLFARGLVGLQGKIVVIDTEQASSEMYDKVAGEFLVVPFGAPYSPERYEEALAVAEEALKDVPEDRRCIIIDQVSYAWAGSGGVLDFVDSQRTSRGDKEGFTAWKKATPKQNLFIERLLTTKAHLICTMRTKVEWVLEKDERGRTVPKKIGLAPVQRQGIEYEFQIVFDLDQDGNEARASKDRTGQFAGQVLRLGIKHGDTLATFLREGEVAPPPLKVQAPDVSRPSAAEVVPEETVKAMIGAAKTKGLDKEGFLAVVEAVAGHRTPAKMTVAQAEEFFARLA